MYRYMYLYVYFFFGDAQEHGFRFQPAGCETFGAPGAGMLAFVEDIAAHAAARSGAPRPWPRRAPTRATA